MEEGEGRFEPKRDEAQKGARPKKREQKRLFLRNVAAKKEDQKARMCQI